MTKHLDKHFISPALMVATLLIVLGIAGMVGLSGLNARADESGQSEPDGYTDFMIGDPDAPLTVVEYASMTCGACAAFHQNVFEEFKKNYIDTGKANFVLRHFVLNGPDLAASMIARCAGEDRYYAFIDLFLKRQSTWISPWQDLPPNEDATLAQLAEMADMHKFLRPTGLSRDRMTACLDSGKLRDDLLRQRMEGQQQYNVAATPTVIINGETYRGGLTYEDFEKALRKAM